MGMFDRIKCEYSLPDPLVQDEIFQTKSLDCLLDDYTITSDGRLILHEVRYEPVPAEERPFHGTDEWDKNPFLQLIGSLRSVPLGDTPLPYHGDIVFYTSLDADGREWFEYKARFTEGALQWIRRVERTDKGGSSP